MARNARTRDQFNQTLNIFELMIGCLTSISSTKLHHPNLPNFFSKKKIQEKRSATTLKSIFQAETRLRKRPEAERVMNCSTLQFKIVGSFRTSVILVLRISFLPRSFLYIFSSVYRHVFFDHWMMNILFQWRVMLRLSGDTATP